MTNLIAIIDAESASVTIRKIPDHIDPMQDEAIKEYFQIDGSSDYIAGDLNVTIDL